MQHVSNVWKINSNRTEHVWKCLQRVVSVENVRELKWKM